MSEGWQKYLKLGGWPVAFGRNAPSGLHFIYITPSNIDEGSLEYADMFLTERDIYTFESIQIGAWQSMVFLREFPCIQFNSIIFDDCWVIYRGESDDKSEGDGLSISNS